MTVQVWHDSHNPYDRFPFGAAPAGSSVFLRLETDGQDLEGLTVTLRVWQTGAGETVTPMTRDGHTFTATLPLPPAGCLLWYYFILEQAGKRWYYGNNASQLGGVGQRWDKDPASYQLTVYEKDTHTPDWFKNAIVYQIFPDRFRKGRNTTGTLMGRTGAVIHSDWYDKPGYWKDPNTGDILYYDFFGGNLAGIREKFDYLKSLGVTALYLNPVFEAVSNHRYDTADYLKLDPMLGTNEEFTRFCKAAKEAGLRVILDGVFSHTGADSRYFNKFGHYPETGAYQSKDSPYYSWYRFKHYPDDYEAWWGVKDLPDVDELNPSYLNFIIREPHSVLKEWLRRGISGWRLDVIDELPEPFLQMFYCTLKQQDPDAVLIGEVWEDASNKVSYGEQRQYLCGRDMDSAMNYAQRALQLDYVLGKTSAEAMAAGLRKLWENYPLQHTYAMLNLVGSHDVERVLTLLTDGGAVGARDAEEAGKARLHLLLTWQFTQPGAPCIYYGDEVGVTGRKDPDNRRTYPWGREDREILGWVRDLAELRQNHAALRTGRFLPVYAQGDGFAFVRSIEGGRDVFGHRADDGTFLVALNRNEDKSCTLTIHSDGLLAGQWHCVAGELGAPLQDFDGDMNLTLPAFGAVVLQKAEPAKKRAGLLLHPTSLPSSEGSGVLGKEAFAFLDFLKQAGQTVWQILPLNPPLLGDSPYLADSAFAGNPDLISLEDLHDRGWLSDALWQTFRQKIAGKTDWQDIRNAKHQTLWQLSHDPDNAIDWVPFAGFCQENKEWLEDYALFKAIGAFFGNRPWTQWPEDVRTHQPHALSWYKRELRGTVDHIKFLQYLFQVQWQALHEAARKKGITILGDLPIYVAHNSADCWAHQELFDLLPSGLPREVAGVPPDYFSKDGQLWGNPLYDWKAMAEDGYAWWQARLQRMQALTDAVRIDHFRAFAAYWAVPAAAKTAKEGTWLPGPGKALFQAVRKALGNFPLVAEDLGSLSPDVFQLRDSLDLPGMKILQFHLKERSDGRLTFDTPARCLAYTGTHDNNTLWGWFREELPAWQQKQLLQELGLPEGASAETIVWALLALLYSRRAETVITPVQDLLALGSDARMNVPGVATGNWHWQLQRGQLTPALAEKLAALAKKYGR